MSATASAATSCRATSTPSAASARSRPKETAGASGSTRRTAVLGSCIEKGSIAVDGVSLTVAAFDDDGLEVALIPHTLAVTTLGLLEPGDELNLEADVLGKVVERLVAARLS